MNSTNNNNNNNNNQRSGKRKRHRRSSLSSSSSVSSVSSGDNNYNSDQSFISGRSKGKNTPIKSVFSGFWSDADLDGDKENKNAKNRHKNKNGSVDHEGFYLTIGETIYEISVGDVVAMRNSSEAEAPPRTDEDDDGSDAENSRERRRKRRLDRDKARREGAPPRDTEILEAPRSSEYAVDALTEKTTDYYQAAPDVDVDVDATTGGNSSKNIVDGSNDKKNAPDASGNSEAKIPQWAGKGNGTIDTDVAMTEASATDAALAVPSQAPPSSLPSPSKPMASLLQPMSKEAKVGDGLMLARIERIWQEKGRGGRGTGKILFRARWFLKKEDVDSLPLGELTGPVSSQEFADKITEHDLVLSNQSDDNHVTTICDLIQVLYRHPDLDTEMPSLVLPATYLCRYCLCIEDDPRVVVLPYSGDNDDWKEMTISALNSRKRSVNDSTDGDDGAGDNRGSEGGLLHNLMGPKQGKIGANSTGGFDDEASQTGVACGITNKKRRRVGDFADEGFDEGIAIQRDIQVGKKHQVYVPSFVPNQKIVSRNPIRMWKPDKISQEGTDDYIERAAQILTPYLREHHLTQEEPYATFPTKRMEELSKSLSWKRLPTLSSVSSVSSLTTNRVDALREFNVDALLRNLYVSNYNIGAAIAAIEASPMDYLIAWSPHEKVRFNTGFRRYSGSLRAIYKGMGDKALQEVIDYHYRFKIPDQFRRVQERKREQAIRMLECIETKRNLNAPIIVSNSIIGPPIGASDENKEKGDWSKTGSSSLAVSIEERRVKAKELLLDVEAKLGRNKMMKVFEVFRTADETALVQCKTKLLEIFQGHQDFQSRFLEFLPQQMRL